MQAISEILGPIVDGAKPVPKAIESATDGVFRSLVEIEDQSEAIDTPEFAEIEVELSGDEPDKASDVVEADAANDPEDKTLRTSESDTIARRENTDSLDPQLKSSGADNARSALLGMRDNREVRSREGTALNNKINQIQDISLPNPASVPDAATTAKPSGEAVPLPTIRPHVSEYETADRKDDSIREAVVRTRSADTNSATAPIVSKPDQQNTKSQPGKATAPDVGAEAGKHRAEPQKAAAAMPIKGESSVETQRPQRTAVDVRAAKPGTSAVPSERGTVSGGAQPQVVTAPQNDNPQSATRSVLAEPATQGGLSRTQSRPIVTARDNERPVGTTKEPTAAPPPAIARANLISGGTVTGPVQLNPQAQNPRTSDTTPAEPAKPDGPVQSPSQALHQTQSLAAAQSAPPPIAQTNVAKGNRFVRGALEPRFEDARQAARHEPTPVPQTRAPAAAHSVAKDVISVAAEGQRQNNIASVRTSSGFNGSLGVDAEEGVFALGPSNATGPQTSVPVSAMPPAGGAQVAQHIARQLAIGITPLPDGAIEIQLSPEELGRVRLVVNTADGNLMLAVQAERPETVDLMRRHIETLIKEFREMGYQNTGFSFEGQSGSDPGTNGSKGAAPSDGTVGPTVAEPAANVSDEALPLNQSKTTGLDLRF